MTLIFLEAHCMADALHKSRLLTVEERPFKRITKRLLDPEKSILYKLHKLPPTPPPDASAGDEEQASLDAEKKQELEIRRQWRDDAMLDFAAFESSIIRIQFLLSSNVKERERYAAEKLKIEATAQAVRDNTTDLRIQLGEAQKMLALRKEYDALAEKITENRLLRPREDQHANIRKLNAEIVDLQRESEEYAQTWDKRREQFDKIVDQTTEMRRQIKDEKEEVERREGMQEEDDEEEQKGGGSGAATPRPGSTLPIPMDGIEKDAGTGARESLTAEKASTNRIKSPLHEPLIIDKEDEDMAEDGEVSTQDDGAKLDVNAGSVMNEKEDSEHDDSRRREDQMDVT